MDNNMKTMLAAVATLTMFSGMYAADHRTKGYCNEFSADGAPHSAGIVIHASNERINGMNCLLQTLKTEPSSMFDVLAFGKIPLDEADRFFDDASYRTEKWPDGPSPYINSPCRFTSDDVLSLKEQIIQAAFPNIPVEIEAKNGIEIQALIRGANIILRKKDDPSFCLEIAGLNVQHPVYMDGFVDFQTKRADLKIYHVKTAKFKGRSYSFITDSPYSSLDVKHYSKLIL